MSTERRSPSSDAQPASVKAAILVGAVCSANCQAHSSLSTKYLAMCSNSVRCFTLEHEKPRHATTHRKPDVGSVPCVVENRSCRATVCASVLILKIVFEVAQLTSCAVFLPGQYLIPRVGAGSLVSTSSPNSSITARARFTSVCHRTPPGLCSMILLESFTWKHLWGPMIPSLLALEVLGQHRGGAVQGFGHTSGSEVVHLGSVYTSPPSSHLTRVLDDRATDNFAKLRFACGPARDCFSLCTGGDKDIVGCSGLFT